LGEPAAHVMQRPSSASRARSSARPRMLTRSIWFTAPWSASIWTMARALLDRCAGLWVRRTHCRQPGPARQRHQKMLTCADALVAYRTYPHVDMARPATALPSAPKNSARQRLIGRPARSLLIPLNGMCPWSSRPRHLPGNGGGGRQTWLSLPSPWDFRRRLSRMRSQVWGYGERDHRARLPRCGADHHP
jgi:hypothetical protein